MFEYSDDMIQRLLRGIYEGSINETELPEPLYHAIANVLKKGVYKGYGIDFKTLQKQITAGTNTAFTKGDFELLSELRDNVYMFSAAKTYTQVKMMGEAAIGDDGFIKPYNEFKKDARQIFDTFNEDYLKTEYNTCVGQATMGAYWQRIENTKDALPYLMYHTIGNACKICSPLNGLTAKVGDPIWKKILPMLHFNCFCTVDQLAEDAEATPEGMKQEKYSKALDLMDDEFKMNAGIDRVVFKADHPYFTAPKELKENNFGFDIPKHD
jgi:Phage Mu protein F like protein